MAMAERTGSVVWSGNLGSGHGEASARSSGAFSNLETTWASRTKRSEGRTSPEELIAVAHASCFSMGLAHELDQMGHPPRTLEVEVTVSLDEVNGEPTVTSSVIQVAGYVPGIEEGQFGEAAENAKNGCPVSRALQGNVDISLEASLKKPA